jgi:tetratricopeptide (TPR) repeat protein
MIYDSSVISVSDATIPGDTGTVVVTFPARTERQGLHRKGFGQDYLKQRGISSLLVKAAWNHWFQVPEAEAAMNAVADVTARFRRVVTYGSSMGGYGAALFSGQLNAAAIIAISPQFSIDRAQVPHERRWATDAARITFLHDDMARRLRREATLNLIYDPRTADRSHAEHLLALSDAPCPLLTPFGDHPAGTYLRDSGLLGHLIFGMITGEFDAAEARRQIRARRRHVASYWSNASVSLFRRHPAIARSAAGHAAALAPDNHSVQYQLGRVLAWDGRRAEACDAFRRATSLLPSSPKYHLAYGIELLNAGRSLEAEAALQKAAELAPSDPHPEAARARALLALGRLLEAREAAEEAGRRGLLAHRVTALLAQIATASSLVSVPDGVNI